MNARSVKDFNFLLCRDSCPLLHFPLDLCILARWIQSLPVVLNESVVDKGILCCGAFFPLPPLSCIDDDRALN